MREALHRSENVAIHRAAGSSTIEVEIRFSSTFARGTCESACPRCGAPGRPAHWELEGPDGRGNTIWFSCGESEDCRGSSARGFTWTQAVDFSAGWMDR